MNIDVRDFTDVEDNNIALTVRHNGNVLTVSKLTDMIMWNDCVVTVNDDYHREQIINFILRNMR